MIEYGKRYGKTVAIEAADSVWKGSRLRPASRFICDCGTDFVRRNDSQSKTCGQCRNHGFSQTPEHKAWIDMKVRCLDTENKRYARYGGRGIQICASWLDFEQFLADMGKRPEDKNSLDRIDNNGNYSCGNCKQCKNEGWASNCRWADGFEQQANTSRTRLIEFRGETLCASEWARRLGMRPQTLVSRLHIGWSMERIASTPTEGPEDVETTTV